jgi:uncharacterized protein YecE (DUF72 family)
MNNLFVGTAGWSYKDWVPNFYPKAQSASFDWLEYYSKFFNVVEVNASYYTYLSPKIVDGWIKKVEDSGDFLFTIKLHQDFTHKRTFGQQQIKAIKFNLDKLANYNRLGGILIQFPYSCVLNKENADHIKKLVDIFSEYDKFIEVRHKSWFIDRFFEFVKSNKSTICTIDQPVLGEAIEFEPIAVGDILYIRFHGRNEKAWKSSIENFGKEQTYAQQSERYDYLYSPGELVEIEQKIKDVLGTVKKIFVIMNNHPKGSAVANALEMLHMLGERIKINVPTTTLQAFPRLSKISLN